MSKLFTESVTTLFPYNKRIKSSAFTNPKTDPFHYILNSPDPILCIKHMSNTRIGEEQYFLKCLIALPIEDNWLTVTYTYSTQFQANTVMRDLLSQVRESKTLIDSEIDCCEIDLDINLSGDCFSYLFKTAFEFQTI